MVKDFFTFGLTAFCLASGYLLGYSVCDDKCTIEKQTKTIAEEQAINDSLNSSIIINKDVQNEVYHATQDLFVSIADVNNEYNSIRSTPINVSNDRVHDKSRREDHKDLSDTSKTTARVSERESRQLKDNAEKFQRLYEAELEKAKKCDMAIVKLNNLIDFYTKVQTNFE